MKVLKPGIVDRVSEDVDALRAVGEFFLARRKEYALPLNVITEAIDHVVELLQSEVQPAVEQRHLAMATDQLANHTGVSLPRLLPFLGTSDRDEST